MHTVLDTDEQHNHLSLTRMIYALCGAIVLYWTLDYSTQFFFARMQHMSWGLYRWYYVTNAWFVAAMLVVVITYRFEAKIVCWRKDSTDEIAGYVKSIALGVIGAFVALLIASPTVWFGWDIRRLQSIGWLIADALSPIPILILIVVTLALALSSEIVFRGVVFRTLAEYTTIPAAALASCMLFACFFPVLGFVVAIILGVTSSILYYTTKNLIAPVIANSLFTVGCSGIVLYHRLR